MSFRPDVPWLTADSGHEVWAEYSAEDARSPLFFAHDAKFVAWLWSRFDRHLANYIGEC